MAEIAAVDPRSPDAGLIGRAAAILRQGGVVVYPTRALYGLGVDAFNAEAVARLFAIKVRDRGKPILVLIADESQLLRVARPPDRRAALLVKHFWPGKVTFVLPAREGLPPGLTAGTAKIGVRLAGNAVAAALVHALGNPVTGTSANLSGGGGHASVAAFEPDLLQAVDMVLDAGPLAGGPGSTVVDITTDPPTVLREGIVPGSDILKVHESLQ